MMPPAFGDWLLHVLVGIAAATAACSVIGRGYGADGAGRPRVLAAATQAALAVAQDLRQPPVELSTT